MSRTFPSNDLIRKRCTSRKADTVYKQPKTKQELTQQEALKELQEELNSCLGSKQLSISRVRLLPTNRDEILLSCFRPLCKAASNKLKEKQ